MTRRLSYTIQARVSREMYDYVYRLSQQHDCEMSDILRTALAAYVHPSAHTAKQTSASTSPD